MFKFVNIEKIDVVITNFGQYFVNCRKYNLSQELFHNNEKWNYYLARPGSVYFLFFRLYVSRITQVRVDGFSKFFFNGLVIHSDCSFSYMPTTTECYFGHRAAECGP